MKNKKFKKYICLLLTCILLTACGKTETSSRHEVKFSSLFDKERVWIVVKADSPENVAYNESVVAIYVTKNQQVTESYLYGCNPLPTLDHFENMSLDDIREEINTTSFKPMENNVSPIEISGELDNSGNYYQYETASFPYNIAVSSNQFKCPIKILSQEYLGLSGFSETNNVQYVFLTLNNFGSGFNLNLDEAK